MSKAKRNEPLIISARRAVRESPNEGFGAMGRPIPNTRRDRAYQWAKSVGVDRVKAFSMVEAVANHLERDHPHEGMRRACEDVDLTGAYMLFAFLLTGPSL